MTVKKLKPTGFVARCQCGVYVAALDARRTEPKEMSRLLGEGCSMMGVPLSQGSREPGAKPSSHANVQLVNS